MKYETGQKLSKNWDGRIVTIKQVWNDFIVLDGDFEDDHVVMKGKVHRYYQEIKEETK